MGDQNGQAAAGVLSPELKGILDQVVVQNKVLAEKTLLQRDALRKAEVKA